MLRRASLQRLRGLISVAGCSVPVTASGTAAAADFCQSLPSESGSAALRRSSTMASTAASSAEEILTEELRATKIAILNRPRKLNALNLAMVSRLRTLYEAWEKDRYINMVIIKGNGRGFCAGGDVAAVYHNKKAGQIQEAIEFFREEYMLNYIIGTYKKPLVALLDGVVMGGGTGISIHGTFRVVTENTIFAMPETAIALHPDVGASYYLSRLPGHLGEYLALTGTRLDGVDMMAVNLATHYVPSHRLEMLQERLGSLGTRDAPVISNAIDEHCDIVHLSPKSPIRSKKEIDSCFGRSSMEEIVRSLEAGVSPENPWYQETLQALKRASPVSLKVTLRSMREGRRQHLYQCLEREFRLSVHAIEGRFSDDFAEGCRAVLVDKDNLPKWMPPSLEQVGQELVDYQFSPLGEDLSEELKLDVKEREPDLKSASYARL